MPVNTPSPEYAAYIDIWSRCRHCYEGSDSVKAEGPAYLPPLDSHQENSKGYDAYRLRALYYNATGRTVEGLAGSIFQKPPRWEVSKAAEEYLRDITLSGVTAEMFALRTTRNVLASGRWGILVDMAKETKGSPSRPYVVGYRAEDIYSWRTRSVGGDQQTHLIVLREQDQIEDPKDEFVPEREERFRVLRLDKGQYVQEVWRKPPGKEDYELSESIKPKRRGVPLSFLPFVFMSATTIEPTIEKPPLIDLVDVNLSHYRTMADLEHGRHYTALPTPWIAGSIQGDEENEKLSIGSGVAWMLDQGGSAGMLEFSGAGLGSLVTADTEKRKMMATLGARLLEDVGGAETATAVGMRHSGEHATLRTIAAVLEQGLSKTLQWIDWWMGTEATPEKVKSQIILNKEFFAIKASPGEVQAALAALQAEKISYPTFYNILSEGGWTREGVDYKKEQSDIDIDREANLEAGKEAQEAFGLGPNAQPPADSGEPDPEADPAPGKPPGPGKPPKPPKG